MEEMKKRHLTWNRNFPNGSLFLAPNGTLHLLIGRYQIEKHYVNQIITLSNGVFCSYQEWLLENSKNINEK